MGDYLFFLVVVLGPLLPTSCTTGGTSGPKGKQRNWNSADELERRLRLENAADGQFSETSGWAALFGLGGGGVDAGRCGAGEGESCGAEDCAPAKRRTLADVLIPIIGGGLVFFGILGLLYKYFDVGSVIRAKVKSAFNQAMDIICDPQTSIFPGIGVIGKAGKDIGSYKASKSNEDCDETFITKRQDRNRKNNVCGKDKIDPNKRKHPTPPPEFKFPIIPGLHDCSDDEDYEEGVFEAPGPHGKV